MAIISLDTAAANAAIKSGSMQKLMASTLEALKPEAAYFGLKDGKRTAFLVFDMQNSADMPPYFEPFFAQLGAEIALSPVMNADDLRGGLGRLPVDK
jgi:hypothetical protein